MSSSVLPPPPWPFPPLPAELGFLDGIDRILTVHELVDVTRRIYESDAWRDYAVVSPEFRDYRLVFENDYTDVWVLSWLPGQATGFHDHDVSAVGITVAQGRIREGHMHLDGAATDHVMEAGDHQEGPFGYIHQIAHEEGDPAVSLHAYSPPLLWVGQYRERGGRMLRLREPGRTRLAP